MAHNPQESQSRRLTRREKIAQQQAEQKPAKPNRVIGRNRLIKPFLGILSATVLAAAAIGGYYYTQSQTDQQTALVVNQETAKSLVQEKIISLGIQRSQKETQLWEQMQNTAESQRNFLNATSKINYVVGAMATSENPYLQEAYRTIQEETKNGNLLVQTVPFPSDRPYLSNESGVGAFSTSLEAFNGKAVVITKAYNELLLQMSPDQIAFGISVEMKHVKNILVRDLVNRGLSPEGRTSKYIEWILQPGNYVWEEASGFMEGSLAYIHHLGLTGREESEQTFSVFDYPTLAVAIQVNFDENNARWTGYIDKSYGFSGIIEEKKKASGFR